MPRLNNPNDRFTALLAANRLDATLLESQFDRRHHQLVWVNQQDQIFMLTRTRTFDLIILAFNEQALEIIRYVRNSDGPNRNTPLIALLDSEDIEQQKKLIDAGFNDCLIGEALEKQLCQKIEYWRDKNNSAVALNYIQIIQSKTKHNHRLTLIIFNKLFEELPSQIEIIRDALNSRQYKLAEETVHKLHGSVSFCDLEDMRESAFAMEKSLINHNYEAVSHHFLMLQEYILNFTRYQQLILANIYSLSK